MLTIEEILAATPDVAIKELKKRRTDAPNVAEIKKQYDVAGHLVMDEFHRPNKTIKVDVKANDPNHANLGAAKEMTKIVKVVRIAVPLQKKIVRTGASFLFGIPVKYNATPLGASQKLAVDAFGKIVRKNKLSSFDRKLARELGAFTEVAEYWHATESDNKDYGFDSAYKLRVSMFSPKNGDILFPLFDKYGDMIAFSRQYSITEEGVDIVYFETYTDSSVIRWKQNGVTWVPVSNATHGLNKIPIVYGRQEETDFHDVQMLIERLEFLLSNHGEINDYHAAPKMVAENARVKGFAQKGEAGGIIEIEGAGGSLKVLSWEHAPESVRMEIENLLKLIHACTQTPELDFEAVKGLGALSGVSRKLLFMDAHLKVMDKREVFDEYLERRVSIIKKFLGEMNKNLETALEDLEIEPEITPYMIDDEAATIDMLMTATGNKPVVSQRTAVRMSGLVTDSDGEYQQITKEQEAEQATDIFEPTI